MSASTPVSPPRIELEELRLLVARLRAPDGCPWDRKQGLGDLRTYLLEEAHEVAAAIDVGERTAIAEELGDLLFQVVFIAQIGAEEGAFDVFDVAAGIHAKMMERHPHVFGDAARLPDAAAVARAWERNKLARRSADAEGSLLDGVPRSLPALAAAQRLTQKAAGVGFDWPDVDGVVAKVREELAEVLGATATGDRQAVAEEVGDLLFAVANLARHLGVDPETSLAGANHKFRRRFGEVEKICRERGQKLDEAGLAELDAAWESVKAAERAGVEGSAP
jgi:MazG family protein